MCGPQRAQAHARAQAAVGIKRRIGEVAAGRDHDDHLFGDRLELGTEMTRALEHENFLVLRLDAEVANRRKIAVAVKYAKSVFAATKQLVS